VAGLAEDLKVFGFVCTAKCEGQNVINVPGFAGVDLYVTACASSFSFEKEVQPRRG
jgi:hypothetical protein